ncbi:MAG: hypothetical protein ABL873_02940, partial [Gallionella sp.]
VLGAALIGSPEEASADVLQLQNYDESGQNFKAENIHYANLITRETMSDLQLCFNMTRHSIIT